jgi:peptide/nickel transport system substrate-binding protein
MPNAYYSNVNLFQFQQLLYRPLYWFGKGDQPVLNEQLSLALPPRYSDHDRRVTITLKPFRWADGKSVTSRDVTFWMNLLKAEKAIWPVYVPGGFPDDVTRMVTPSPRTIVFYLSGPFSPRWFTYNELSQITPLPQHAWDKTSASGPIGNYDESTAGARAVYKFLSAQARDTSTYATNPLWKVVDGPWLLSQYQNTGYTVLVPNQHYSGSKPYLTKLIEEPFTTDSAEYAALRAGQVTYGYIPYADASQRPLLASKGYTFAPWVTWGINYFPENYNNPVAGPIFRQLYVRQAMQMLIDQPGDIKAALHGYGVPTYGPVPIKPPSSLASGFEKRNPYPYDPRQAASLLTSHGWAVHPGGVSTCTHPGNGTHQCGPGVERGARMSFNLQYVSGSLFVNQDMQALKSSFSSAGIEIHLSQAPFQSVIATAAPCKPSQSSCSWQMENWGQGWSYGPDFYPTGEEIFACGAGINEGSYCDRTAEAYINATTRPGNAHATMVRYEDYLTRQLPVIWQPEPDFQLSEVRSSLHGALPQSSVLNFTPAAWYFTK